MTTQHNIAIGLGSNVGNRAAMLSAAAAALRAAFESCVFSTCIETPALLPAGAPPEWDVPFLNQAMTAQTTLPPQEVLAQIKAIEIQLGRTPRGHWGPREIDLDLLLYEALVLETPTLTLPHPQMLTRDFVLRPLAEIAPEWVHPLAHKTIRELL